MENLIIESDNLIAMRKLLPEYEGKIDVIQIFLTLGIKILTVAGTCLCVNDLKSHINF